LGSACAVYRQSLCASRRN